mmetsp:Transcript_16945/g.59226  ORF Transcript_16945/g.59226 Transcript_16945/m.59226 type:complete len:189 (-) Transcript_16945:138-704(-)
MGGCESCASSRRKEVSHLLRDASSRSNISELKTAIAQAEQYGVDALSARQQYSELAKNERQSPESVHEMLIWSISTQDGVILFNVIQEAESMSPDHQDLRLARAKLAECQEEARVRIQRLVRNRDARSLTSSLERARRMGVPSDELAWAENSLFALAEAQQEAARRSLREGETTPKCFVAPGPPPLRE